MPQPNPAALPTLRVLAVLLGSLVVLLPFARRVGGSPQEVKGEGTTISGEIFIERGTPAFKDARLFVYLVKYGEDAPAELVSQLIIDKVSGGGSARRPLPFAFGEFPLSRDAQYLVRVLIDVNPGEQIKLVQGNYVQQGLGDYISMKRYPVLPGKATKDLKIDVELIRP